MENRKENNLPSKIDSEFQELASGISEEQYSQQKKLAYEDYHRLTEMQRKFVENYLRTGNASKSAKLAGYSKTNHQQISTMLLKKEKIQRILEVKRRELAEVYGLSKEKLCAELNEIKKEAEAEGNKSMRIKCIEMQGKMLGFFTDTQVSNNILTDTNIHISLGGKRFNPDKSISKDYDAEDIPYEDLPNTEEDENE